ncbi:hypothetical protein A0256_09615 [Mucilaginibacter sp. PAMC 26640]|nr:hypothetical protein A0256_09615 [Mucilaginibacter sp. PAMC 26640]
MPKLHISSKSCGYLHTDYFAYWHTSGDAGGSDLLRERGATLQVLRHEYAPRLAYAATRASRRQAVSLVVVK